MAQVFDSNGNSRKVKNLGWIIRNHAQINYFTVQPTGGDSFQLSATLKNGGWFTSKYESFTVSLQLFWFRSIFEGLEVRFYDCSPSKMNRRVSRKFPNWQVFHISDTLISCYTIGYFANQWEDRRGVQHSDYAFCYCGPDRVAQLTS